MRVLALDPGERIGFATGTIDGPALEVDTHGISRPKPMALKLHEVAGEYDLIIYETYRLFAHKAKQQIGSDFPASQFIGMVRLCAWLNPKVKLVSQGASILGPARQIARAHYPDVQRRIDAMPAAHDERHDESALLHIVHYHFKKYA